MQKRRFIFALSLVSLACAATTFAATPINLQNKHFSNLNTFLKSPLVGYKELNRHVDFNQTSHVRIQETYAGHPVWGADAIFHVPHQNNVNFTQLSPETTMNGIIYDGIAADLANAPAYALSEQQAEKALQHAIQLHQKKTNFLRVDNAHIKKMLMVYIDNNNQAHWAYFISFISGLADGTPAVPTYILDAASLNVYEEWNNLQTLDDVSGGGFGGNPKLGKLVYDGLSNNYPMLDMQRNATKNICSIKNKDVIVKDDTHSSGPFDNSPVAKFNCASKDSKHNNVYWDGDSDATNEGYSPVNDSLYIGKIIKGLYQTWYGLPVLTFMGMPLPLTMHAHAKDLYGQPMDNAYFLSLTMEMYYGDGVKLFYPLTSLGVGAHEISHGFTSQHSNLTYEKQSGGLNESYSDMAAQAAEFYSTGKNSWQIGPEIVKGTGALRYMDDPTKDGKSIDNVKNYTDDLNVHYSSGVFNKLFYLLGTTKGWDTHKAFDVMVKANMDYWTANSTFADAACGVLNATKDHKYKVADVARALKQVGIDGSKC